MGKRSVVADGPIPYTKRQKVQHGSTAEDIHSSRQLQQLVSFDQDAGRARHGIQSFKNFLDSLSEEPNSDRYAALKEFLQAEVQQDQESEEAAYLADIMKTWSFAAQSNNDSVLSAVPAVLALLLKTLSGQPTLTEYGLRLGRTLLQKRQLELFARGATANKTKDFVISPCLRLLREVVMLDGGSLAKQVFRARDSTLKGLGRNLGLRYTGDVAEDRRKPSVRTNAVRYLIACLKFLPTVEKRELLNQKDILSGLTRDINYDPPFLVADILEAMKLYVLQDATLPRDAKSKLLNSTHLGRIVNLYGYNQEDDQAPEDTKTVDVQAHDFLKLACTTPDVGVLRYQTGFYPPGVIVNGGGLAATNNFIDLGLDGLGWFNSFTEKVPVRNIILSELIQTLRPWSNMMQSELLLAIFAAAPELVADYFFNKKNFSFEPKLTPTWIGYSAVVFSTVQLPLPEYFGQQSTYAQLPPSSSIVIESIIPQPVTQKILTRCLNQQSELITFFAMRFLIVAFEKLQDVLGRYRQASSENQLIWEQARDDLVKEFCQRCPPMKDAIHAYKNTPETNLMERQAGSKLLVKYYDIVPQMALESMFDVAGLLAQALRGLSRSFESPEDKATIITEIGNLLQIAQRSPGMRWFNKVESLSTSPFTAMVRLCAESSSDLPMMEVRTVLDSVAKVSGILQSQTSLSSVDALIAAVMASKSDLESDGILEFLDNCALRCSAMPIKYIDVLERDAGDKIASTAPCLSLLLVAMVEQWQYILKTSEVSNLEQIAKFISHHMAASLKIQEDKDTINAMIEQLVAAAPQGELRKQLERSRKLAETLDVPKRANLSLQNTKAGKLPNDSQDKGKDIEGAFELYNLPPISEDHTPLHRWASKDLATVVEDHHAASLIRLLSSTHLHIRKEAHTNLSKIAHSLQLSDTSIPAKSQLWLLLSELLESTRAHISTCAIPTPITAFAALAIAILQNPLHIMYPKLNTFLCRGPTWNLSKIPLLNAILDEAPTIDDSRYQEFDFLLSYLLDALLTEEDLIIFYKKRVVEKLLVQFANPYLGQGMKERILGILWRVAAVVGGSTTLVTRCGILSWINVQMSVVQKAEMKARLTALRAKILDTCDANRVEAWAGCHIGILRAELS